MQALTFINTIGLIVLISFLLFKSFFVSEKIAYVDTDKLFDGFYMTKELKKIGEKEFNAKKIILDSLYSKLQSNTISEAEKKQIMPQFVQEKQELEQFNQSFAEQESLKIWSRIHNYIDTYSKETSYKLIISGSQNKQTILYVDDKVDITNELLIYINNKYEGVK